MGNQPVGDYEGFNNAPLDYRVLLLYRIGRACDGISQDFATGYKELRNMRSVLIPVLDSKFFARTKELNEELTKANKQYYSASMMDRDRLALTSNELLWKMLDELILVANRKKMLNIGMAKAEVVQ